MSALTPKADIDAHFWRKKQASYAGSPDQSAFAPRNLTTLGHFSVSSATSFPKSAREPGSSDAPSSPKYLRCRIVEDRIDRLIKLVDDLAGLTSALDPVEHYILNVRLGLPFRKVSA